MTQSSIVSKLNKMYETLDEMQETCIFQMHKELLVELGETMGHIDNILDIIKSTDTLKNEK